MLNLRIRVGGLVAVLLVGGMASAQTPTPTSLEAGTFVIEPQWDFIQPFTLPIVAKHRFYSTKMNID